MATVLLHSVASVDGFIADLNDDPGPLHEWYFGGDTPITPIDDTEFDHSGVGARFRVAAVSAGYVRSTWDSLGVIVMGRRLFDLTNGWEGHPPAGEHVVMVSHRPKPDGWHPEASYHFSGDVVSAIEKAQQLAGERTIAVNAGIVGGQVLAAGLVDEVAIDVVPVVFGTGRRFFGDIDSQHLLEDPDVVIRGERVLHLRYAVRR